MYNDQQAPNTQSRLETIAYYLFLGTVILAPLAFWASPYVPQDLIKTFVISLGTIITAILLGFVAIKERRLAMPPRSIVWTAFLMVLSLVISSLNSINSSKSFFGQGFEIGTAGFILALFLAAWVAYTVISRRPDRAVVAYVGMVVAFLILYLYQFLLLVLGPAKISLGIFNTVTSSLIGGWYNIGTFAIIIAIISLIAIKVLPLTGKMKIIYWVLLALSAIGAIIVNDYRVWMLAILTFFGLTVYFTFAKARPEGGAISSFFKRIAWFPLIACVVSVLFFYQPSFIGTSTDSVVNKLNANYSELSLPWQMTLDVTASSIKNYPLFGVGPNHFGQAFLAYKPAGINQTSAWGTEFANGFGLITTFIATQGLVGMILWILFFVFFGIIGVRTFKNMPQESDKKFALLSSYFSAAFIWLMAIVSVPSHAILFYAFVLTGIFLGTAVSSGAIAANDCAPLQGTSKYKMFPSIIMVLVLIALVWGLANIKKTIAFAYFASGVKQLSVAGNAKAADTAFAKSLSLDQSDIYWQARVEASLKNAQQLAATVTSTSTASTSEAVVKQINTVLDNGAAYANKAIAYDKTNYYNYLSLARVSESALSIKMPNAYENAVQAYTNAANLNPYNPSIYLSLANVQANNNKLDDALKTAGAALQVKNNYLDAIFLLSQIYAAKGDLPNAIVAAKVATQLNPGNAFLLFQLGILDYNNKDYSGAVDALTQAVKIQPDYSNAKYFLGLSDVRIGSTTGAIAQFEDLVKTNPDNQEVGLILTNLKAGKPIFNDAKAPVTTTPEKRAKLPIKEKSSN